MSNMTDIKEKQSDSAKYGLKVVSLYNAKDYKVHNINTTDMISIDDKISELILSESGTYNIVCNKDIIIIKHGLDLDFIHIYCVLKNDNLRLNIVVKDKVSEGREVDVYHNINNYGSDNSININFKSVVTKDSGLIYRSKVENFTNQVLKGESKSEVFNFSNTGRVIVEPSLSALGQKTQINHETQIYNYDTKSSEYLSLYALGDIEIKEIMINSFLN